MKSMKPITGYTVSELMEKTGKSRSAIESFISRHGIEAVSHEAIYPLDTLEKLLKAKVGRPARKPAPEASKKPRKTS